MAGKVTWSPEAVDDLESICSHIARDSESYACAVATQIVSTAESIPDHPMLGRSVPELRDPKVRERFVHRYRIIYKVEPDRILMIALIHGSRLLSVLENRFDNE